MQEAQRARKKLFCHRKAADVTLLPFESERLAVLIQVNTVDFGEINLNKFGFNSVSERQKQQQVADLAGACCQTISKMLEQGEVR